MDRRAVTRRQRCLAALIGAPAIAAAIGLAGIEAWRQWRPRSLLFAPPFAYSLAEAIETANLQRAYQYIRAGQDPNGLIAVRHPVLTQRRWVLTSPLLWAVAVGNIDAVKMLLGYGARFDRVADRQAICLAEALGHHEVLRVLGRYGEPSDLFCGEFESGDPALLRVLADRGLVRR